MFKIVTATNNLFDYNLILKHLTLFIPLAYSHSTLSQPNLQEWNGQTQPSRFKVAHPYSIIT